MGSFTADIMRHIHIDDQRAARSVEPNFESVLQICFGVHGKQDELFPLRGALRPRSATPHIWFFGQIGDLLQIPGTRATENDDTNVNEGVLGMAIDR